MIVRTRGGADLAMRSFADSSTNPPSRTAASRGAGVPVTSRTVGGIPAFTRAVRIRAEAVASLRMRVWTGIAPTRKAVDGVWQARLLRGKLSELQTRFQFWETVEESLAKRGNAYIWINTDPDTGRATELIALHPDQVAPMFAGRNGNEAIVYNVVIAAGYVDPTGRGFGFYQVGPDVILHIRGHGDGGALVSPSPIELYREALGVGIAKLRHEANLYGRGTAVRLSVEFPAGVTTEQAKDWRDLWSDTYEGPDGESTAVIGGGATLKPIGLSMADTQFIQSQNFGVAEAGRIVGVPASLLDSGERTSTSTPKLPEWEQTRFLRYGLGPGLERIESAFEAHPALELEPAPGLHPAFDTQKFVRGDLTTESNIALAKVQSGQWTPDEARALDGLPPLPDGMGAIPIFTPVGAAPNPSPPPNPGGDAADPEDPEE